MKPQYLVKSKLTGFKPHEAEIFFSTQVCPGSTSGRKKNLQRSVAKNIVSLQNGQAVVETLLILPFIFLMLVWLLEYFQTIHSATLHQIQARHELWKAIDNARDLRDSTQDVARNRERYALGLANEKADTALYANGKKSFSIEVAKRKKDAASPATGNATPPSRVRIESHTVVGICRDLPCQ